MSTPPDPRVLEPRLYQEATFGDGILDLLIGVGLLAFGFGMMFENSTLFVITPILVWSLWQPLRRWVTAPRLGYVRFSQERRASERRRLRGLSAGLTVSLLLGLALMLALSGKLDQVRELLRPMGPTPLGVVLAGLLGLVAGLFKTWWFFGYAVAVLGAVGLHFAGVGFEYGLAAAGMAIALSGGLRLWRFVRRHPAPATDLSR